MSEPFLGEIRVFGFNFAPQGWASCNGQILPIAQNQALFALLGTTYGGDGQRTFALPDLRSRAAMHLGSLYPQGQSAGAETVQLTLNQIPSHTHAVNCGNAAANQASPAGGFWAQDNQAYKLYSNSTDSALAPGAVGAVGGQPHPNLQPYLCVNFCIALQGIFPSRN
ncbi:MAG: phage tail protein [Terriglobia bacterium]